MIDILDVSAAQGVIDWAKVIDDPVTPGSAKRWRGVICKVSENETWKDQMRAANIAGARAHHLAWGAYAFIHPMSDVKKQVANMYEAIGDMMPSFAAALDVEAADSSLDSAKLVDQIRRGRDAVLEQFGRAPMIYTYPDFYVRRLMPAIVEARDLFELDWWWAYYGAGVPWYPNPAARPPLLEPFKSLGKEPILWQYSGNTKKVPNAWTARVAGIYGDVDRNLFLGTEEEFQFGFCGRPRPDQLEPEAPIVHAFPDFPRDE